MPKSFDETKQALIRDAELHCTDRTGKALKEGGYLRSVESFPSMNNGDGSTTTRVKLHTDTILSPSPVLVSAKRSVLEDASEIIDGERQKSYGHALPNHERIAALWTAWLAHREGDPRVLEPEDVVAMMVLVKLARLQNDPTHRDSLTDLAGYAGVWEKINDRRAENDRS